MNIIDSQAALGFLVSQRSHIETEVNQTQYPEIQYPGLIPVDTTAHPYARTVTYYSGDRTGKAQWLNGDSDDIPKADTDMAEHQTQVYSAGIGYGYGMEELQVAIQLGIQLTADKANAARRAYEEFVDEVAIVGDASKNFQGLIGHSSVPVQAAGTGNWGSATADQILKDANDAIQFVHTQTSTVAVADTLLLPWEKHNLIATKRVTDTNMTVLEFLQRSNIYTATTGQPITIRGMRKLSTAGAGGVARMVAYRRNPQVLKLHLPMPHRFLPAWQSGPMRFDVPGIFRMGGLDIRRPKEVVYVDGI